MRRPLGSVLLLVMLVLMLGAGLGGCGDDEEGTVTDEPAPTASTSTPTKPDGPTDAVDFELVATLTETAVGGQVDEVAVPLMDDGAVQEFAAQFETDTMETRLYDVVRATEVGDDQLLYGAVVAVGCDAPTEVTVTSTDSGLLITAKKVPSPQQECFAPMTTVALVLVPADAVD